MAELTNLETKLGEVIGLAMAAQETTKTVRKMLDDEFEGLARTLEAMHKEAAEAEARAIDVASERNGKKTAILDEARHVKSKAVEMMGTYLDDGADGLDGFEFLTMAEASEVGHWSVLGTLGERAGDEGVRELVEWQLPVQRRHFAFALEGAVDLAASEDPNETSG